MLRYQLTNSENMEAPSHPVCEGFLFKAAVGNLGPSRQNLMARGSFQTLYYGARVLVIVIQNGST